MTEARTPQTSRLRPVTLAALTLATGLALTACDGGDHSDPAPATASPPAVVTQTVSTTAPASPADQATAPGGGASTEGTTQEAARTGSAEPTAGEGQPGLQCTPPTDPESYADRFVQAWGVGDRAVMDCLATPDAVAYALRYRDPLGPGWTQLRATGEQQTRRVSYGSPNHKTVADVTVDRGGFSGGQARQHQVVSVRIG